MTTTQPPCQKCEDTPKDTNHSHCPKCNAVDGYRYWEDAWANNWACDNCGYKFRYSLGD
jgi:Zn ribbon nucleic-acid-binding protein